MKRIALAVTVIVLCLSLSGCASITNGTSEPVSVNTASVTGATCSLQNNKGTWYVNKTPGSTTVHRSYGDLRVKCHKDGYRDGQQIAKSHTKPMAFGNIIFGGALGAGVDVADGAAYDYPSNITVPMQHRS
jgi:hypothetical protein